MAADKSDALAGARIVWVLDPAKLEIGDIVLSTSDDENSVRTREAYAMDFSHVAIYTGIGLVEAALTGVRRRSVMDRTGKKREWLGVRRLKENEKDRDNKKDRGEQVAKAAWAAEQLIGFPFAWDVFKAGLEQGPGRTPGSGDAVPAAVPEQPAGARSGEGHEEHSSPAVPSRVNAKEGEQTTEPLTEWESRQPYFCSMLVAHVFRQAGVTLSNVPPEKFLPQEFLKCPDLVDITDRVLIEEDSKVAEAVRDVHPHHDLEQKANHAVVSDKVVHHYIGHFTTRHPGKSPNCFDDLVDVIGDESLDPSYDVLLAKHVNAVAHKYQCQRKDAGANWLRPYSSALASLPRTSEALTHAIRALERMRLGLEMEARGCNSDVMRRREAVLKAPKSETKRAQLALAQLFFIDAEERRDAAKFELERVFSELLRRQSVMYGRS